jgi:hypothetical protein
MRAEKFRHLEELKKHENQEFYKNRVEEERLRILNHEKKIKKMEKVSIYTYIPPYLNLHSYNIIPNHLLYRWKQNY